MRSRSLRLPAIAIGLGLLALLLIGAASVSGHPTTTAAQHPIYTPVPADYTVTVPQGVPAIVPRASLAKSSGPHFTTADVRQYLAQYPPEFAVPGAPAPQIVSIRFLPAHAVDAMIGEPVGVPENVLLCVVSFTGTFQSTDVPYGVTAYVFHSGLMIFDATTGNLLVSSVGA